MQHIW